MAQKNPSISLIRVDELVRFINYIILTGRLKNEHIVSCAVISDVEMGKSKLLEVFIDYPTVEWANDLSGKVMMKVFLPKVERREKTHLVISDLLKVLAHNKAVVRNVITLLNSFVEEGIKSSLFYGSTVTFKSPVKGGVIFAVTKAEYEKRKQYWKDIGFISRCIILTFSYSEDTIIKIHDYIASGCPAKSTCKIVLPPKKDFDVIIDPKIEAEIIKTIAIERSSGTGFRLHHHLRGLVKAIAYYNRGKTAKKVIREDIDELRSVLRFANMSFTEI